MDFTDQYCTAEDKGKEGNEKKKVISDDTFALGSVLDNLTKELRRLRK